MEHRGVIYRVIEILMERLNSCYVEIMPADETWGNTRPNGTWTGMIGQLQRKEAELAIGALGITPERKEVVDFSDPIFLTGHEIIYPRPEMGPDLAGFIKPFALYAWLAIFLVILLLALSLSALKLVSPATNYTQVLRSSSSRASSPLIVLNNSLEWTFGVLLMQSLSWTGRTSSSSSWFLVGVWILLSFIVSTVYKCNLKAMLISPKIVLPFDNFEELLAQDEIKYRVPYHSVLHQTVKDAEADSLMGKAYMKVSGYAYNDVVLAATEIGKGKYALLVDTLIAKAVVHFNFMLTGRCEIAFTRGRLPLWFLPSVLFTKGSPLLEETNKIIHRLKEFGILEQWLNELFMKGRVCFTPGDAEAQVKQRALALYDFYGVFILWATGLCIAFLTFLVELMIKYI